MRFFSFKLFCFYLWIVIFLTNVTRITKTFLFMSLSDWIVCLLKHNSNLWFTFFLPEPVDWSQREWLTDTISTVSWSISSPSTSEQGMLTLPNGNGWWTSTVTLIAPTWVILTCSTTFPSLKMKAKLVFASTWWRRCFSHVDHLQTNPMMHKTQPNQLLQLFFPLTFSFFQFWTVVCF